MKMGSVDFQQIISEAQRKVLKLTEELGHCSQDILNQYPLPHYIEALDKLPRVVTYSYVFPEITGICSRIISEGDIRALALYHQLVLATLIVDSPQRLKFNNFTEDVIHLLYQNFLRILNSMDQNLPEFYQYSNDKFSKDLSVCMMRLIPLGAQKVNVNGIPRQLMMKTGLGNGMKMWWNVLSEMGGFRPLYELHTDEHDASVLFEFTPDGWDRFYFRVAAMMERNKEIKGIFGISWFFDPQLERISPRLNFLRERPLNNGGRFFFVSQIKDGSGGALARSATRQKLFEQGQYVPTNYMLVWPRQRLIHWADAMKKDNTFIKKLNTRSF